MTKTQPLDRWFVVKVTAKSGTGASATYSFAEWWLSGSALALKTGGRTGDTTTNPGMSVGAELSVGDFALCRSADGEAALKWELVPFPLVAGANLTVDLVSGSPVYTGITTLRFDQADGFTITNPSTGVARIDFSGVTGSGVSGRVAYWNGTSSLTSTSGFEFDGASLTVPSNVACAFLEAGIVEVSGGYISSDGNITSDTHVQAPSLRALDSNWGYTFTGDAGSSSHVIGVNSGGVLSTSKTGTLGPGAAATGGIITDLGSGSFVGTASANAFTNTNTFPNTGLTVKDTDDSHALAIAPGSDLSADRTFTLTTGDANRTLDISAGNVTVTTAGNAITSAASAGAQRTVLGLGTADSPTFAGATFSGAVGVTGTVTATTFSGSGASLTSLPAAELTGTLPAISGANLTSLNASNLSSGTLAVDYGGTGRTSHTAYAVICGGTTSTGAQQSIASVGTSGQVLTSNGAGALPTFQTPSSSLDITGLTAADPADADEVPVYDASATANRKVTVQEINALTGLSPGGRLTGSSTLPVTTGDTVASTLYYLPFMHNRVPLWDGTRWLAVTVADSGASLALSGLTSGRVYDVFGYLSSGALALETLIWTNDTTRATDVTIQDGRYCKDGDKTRLYLGTFYSTSTTTITDSVGFRYLWNMYNRRSRPMRAVKTSGSWTYATNTWRSANADATLRCQFVLGIAEDAVVADVRINTTGGSTAGTVGVGLDQTAGNDAQVLVEAGDPSGTGYVLNTHARYNGNPAAGYHYLQWVEKVRAGTMTFRADLTPSVGMEAEVWA